MAEPPADKPRPEREAPTWPVLSPAVCYDCGLRHSVGHHVECAGSGDDPR